MAVEARDPFTNPRRATMTAEEWTAPIAILATSGRDGEVAGRVLSRAGFTAQVCADVTELCATVQGDVGALLIAEEALSGRARDVLLETLEAQPSWSDV